MGFIAALIIIVLLYFLPSLIASRRDTMNKYTVFVINLFFGWTLLGWVICLAMSGSGFTHRNYVSYVNKDLPKSGTGSTLHSYHESFDNEEEEEEEKESVLL